MSRKEIVERIEEAINDNDTISIYDVMVAYILTNQGSVDAGRTAQRNICGYSVVGGLSMDLIGIDNTDWAIALATVLSSHFCLLVDRLGRE